MHYHIDMITFGTVVVEAVGGTWQNRWLYICVSNVMFICLFDLKFNLHKSHLTKTVLIDVPVRVGRRRAIFLSE